MKRLSVLLGHLGRVGACFVLVAQCWLTPFCSAQESTNAPADAAATQAEMDRAIEQVKKIINQPVTRYARTRSMRVGRFPYWFHEGAAKPDFNTVDVRATQEKIYDQYDYVTSDLNPGVVFPAKQLEFNSMTKYFYVDRTVPKKKLTEAEMLEINRLYRIIGRCEDQLARLQNPATAAEEARGDGKPATTRRLLNPYTGGALLIVAIILLLLLRGRS